MAKSMKCLLAAALASVDGVRFARMKGADGVHSKMIAGVPVLNYDQAYGGRASVAQTTRATQDWVVVAEAGVTDEQIKQLCGMSKCMRYGHPSSKGFGYFEIRATEEELATVLKAAKGVAKFVEPDTLAHAVPEFAAPAAAKSWGLDKIGVASASNKGSGANVYVLDTGILPSHTDFGGRVTPTLDMTVAATECGGDLTCAMDRQGHGTHCAGTAAGATFGVAPGAAIYSVKVLSDTGSGQFSWSYDALDWISTQGQFPAVASMSLGGQGVLAAMEAAVDSAVSAGVVVVVAGGNSNADACGFSPAFVPSAITVGSTDKNDLRSSFSNYGTCTDIWAPGRDITSAAHDDKDGDATFSGTSMACPHVSGASAILLTANPAMTAGDVVESLLSTAMVGAIADLKAGDTNKLLWVGSGQAPTFAPTPAPPPTPSVCQEQCSAWWACFTQVCASCPQC